MVTREPTITDRGRKSRRIVAVPIERQTTQRTKPSSLSQIRFCPVDRNRRIPNGPSGGVGGRRERSRLLPDWFNLAPVAFDHDPAVVTVLPVGLHPALIVLWWVIPAAWGPGVVVVVVAMIAVDPDRLPVRPRTAALVHIVRWPDPDRYLRQ